VTGYLRIVVLLVDAAASLRTRQYSCHRSDFMHAKGCPWRAASRGSGGDRFEGALSDRCDATTNPGDRAACAAVSLYEKLENIVVPSFYGNRERFLDVMRHAIALNGSFFNTQRMVLQYVLNAYFE
jgi:hypothetical protein